MRSTKAGSRRRPPARRTGKRVAVVGSGPAGLAAADQLNRAGHPVTVFERADRIGGLLRYGIPEFKLEKRVLDRRLAAPEPRKASTFRTSCHVGVDVPVDELRAEFDALVLAGGSTRPRDLPVPGPRSRGHSLRDGVSAAAEPPLRRRRGSRRSVHHGEGQARRHHRRRRHRRRLPRHRAPAGRPRRPSAGAAAASTRRRARRTTRGRSGRTSSASRRRTRRAASGCTPSPPSSSTATSAAASPRCARPAVETVSKDGRLEFNTDRRQRVRDQGGSRAAGDGLPRSRARRHARAARRPHDRSRHRLARRARG